MSSNLEWIFVAHPADIAAALEVPQLTFTDTLHHYYSGIRYNVRGVNETHTMYPLEGMEDFVIKFFGKQADDAALTRIYEKSIPIRRKLIK